MRCLIAPTLLAHVGILSWRPFPCTPFRAGILAIVHVSAEHAIQYGVLCARRANAVPVTRTAFSLTVAVRAFAARSFAHTPLHVQLLFLLLLSGGHFPLVASRGSLCFGSSSSGTLLLNFCASLSLLPFLLLSRVFFQSLPMQEGLTRFGSRVP